MLEFVVTSPSPHEPSHKSGAVLQQDRWNDFSFLTQYDLYLYVPEFSGRIGTVKILRRGQASTDPLQLDVGNLPPLSEDFCSLGQELDYYERLASLPESLRQAVLLHLRDALAFPEHAETFFDEAGWTTSVLRYIDWDTFRRDASVLLERDYDRVARLTLEMKFHATGWRDPLHLRFDAGNNDSYWYGLGQRNILPERVAVIVGRNGSGKSTLLARLARVLHASQRDRASEQLQTLGSIEPAGIGFTRVLNVAYSAFDTFQVPGVDAKERRQILDDLNQGTGRYYFCGLRDIVREVEGGFSDGRPGTEADDSTVDRDRQRQNVLKSSAQLAEEFERAVKRIWDANQHELFRQAVGILTTDPSFQDLGPNPTTEISQTPRQKFDGWSAGHKIVMHATASMIAYTEAKSIVLMDEPESHLHPPLLAAFMHAVRHILETKDAFAVVATHSPVVAQETLGRHVSVVRRTGDETTIRPPKIETYGESIGEISDEVFGLNSEATDFHKALLRLVESGMSLENIEAMFERGLSLQARAYVMTEITRRRS